VLINCLPDGRVVDAEPGETILFADLRAAIPHAHACGGKGKCTTCRIAVVEGLENCPPRNELEAKAAARLGFAAEIRLACQTRPNGEVTFRRLVLDDKDREIASQLTRKRTGPVGESKPLAVLFSDIRGFTTLSQTLSPYDVMFALNRHFAELGEIVERNGGAIDSFIGDALMALFGVDGDGRAPFRSVKAAVEMLEANARMAPHMEATYGHAFPIGIGVHYGEAVIGTLGSSSNARLTAIGDTVNVASRIEAANKQAGTRLLISSELYELVKDDVIMEDFIRVKLPGTQERMSLHEISGIKPEALERDRAETSADSSSQRYAGKTWTAIMDAADLPADGRRLIELAAFDVLVIRSGETIFALNNACPHLRFPLTDSDVTDDGLLVCKWHQSCFDLLTGEIRAWCPGLDPDGTLKAPVLKPLGNVSKNRAPLAVFPVRVSDGKIWAALE
jgi:class 3 adenylate cyclase/nitrite reductase/ring-hydroxylating ferredoxin subunit